MVLSLSCAASLHSFRISMRFKQESSWKAQQAIAQHTTTPLGVVLWHSIIAASVLCNDPAAWVTPPLYMFQAGIHLCPSHKQHYIDPQVHLAYLLAVFCCFLNSFCVLQCTTYSALVGVSGLGLALREITLWFRRTLTTLHTLICPTDGVGPSVHGLLVHIAILSLIHISEPTRPY